MKAPRTCGASKRPKLRLQAFAPPHIERLARGVVHLLQQPLLRRLLALILSLSRDFLARLNSDFDWEESNSS
jgi:hypothetical protein